MEEVVTEVLARMRQRLGEELTLDDLAEMAMFSKFHFARMFRRVTGVSPRQFLYALRLQEAKRLLTTTSMSVADISNQVGYRSVGTFTSRFTASVGVPPTEYRRRDGRVAPVWLAQRPDPTDCGVIAGRVDQPDERAAGRPILVSLLRRPVPEGPPARSVVSEAPGDWSFRQVPDGIWYVLAVSLYPDDEDGFLAEHELAMMGVYGPVRVCSGAPAEEVTVLLRPRRPVDPPILFPLKGLGQRRRTQLSADPGTGLAGRHSAVA